MSATDQPSEDELRAAYEAEIKKIRIDQILLEQVVSIINLGMRRTGLAPGTEDERDIDQVRVAIEAVRALLPLIEQAAPAQAGQIRDALAQLQMAFVRLGGAPGTPAQQPAAGDSDPGAAGPQGPAGPGAARPLPDSPSHRSPRRGTGDRLSAAAVSGFPASSRLTRRSSVARARLAPGFVPGSPRLAAAPFAVSSALPRFFN